jgi:CHAT domain-containing protein/predicted negative regulator of RcsB-dependent stress response
LSKYRQALEILPKRERKDLRARLLTNIGYIYQATGDPWQALSYYKEALPIHREAQNNSGIALTLNNMGVAYASLGDPRQGINLLNEALVIRHTIGERGAQAASLLEVGTAYQKARDLRQAEESFRQALELAEKVESSALQAEGHFRLAALQSREGRLEPALKEIQASIAIVESLRSNVLGDKLRNTFFASKRAYYELFIDILMKLEALHPGQYQEAALEASEGARSRGLLDLLARGNIDVQKGIDPGLKQREIELIARLSDLQNKLGRAKATEAAALEHQLENIQVEMEDLASQIRLKNRQYAEVRYPTPLHLKDIQAALDDRTALLQYFTAQDGTFLFVVTRQGLESHRLPPREELASQVMAIRQMIQKRGKRQLGRFEDLAARLYAELIAPAEGTLRTKDRLLIAPDGPLYLLPFEALLTGSTPSRSQEYRDLPYLLRRFSISYIPSASVLQGLRSGRAPLPERAVAKKFVGFADPVFSRDSKGEVSRGAGEEPARQGLERLNESGKEVQRIASLYPSKDVLLYTGALATKANVQKVKAARQIDFATHGTLNETRPELSSLELTDGRLTVYEIFNLQLDADIITLSACDTGLGHEVSGEGIVGMNRAFFYAGAKSLVVSLWPVSDRSTSDLMYDFYRHLGKSEEKRDALRRAKLAMIQSDRYAEPYYWAPLVLSGEPR